MPGRTWRCLQKSPAASLHRTAWGGTLSIRNVDRAGRGNKRPCPQHPAGTIAQAHEGPTAAVSPGGVAERAGRGLWLCPAQKLYDPASISKARPGASFLFMRAVLAEVSVAAVRS